MEILLPLLAAVGAFMLWPVLAPICSWDTIYGADGEHPVPYMTRIIVGHLRFHIFHRGDWDPDPHNHPWEFWTFPLTPYIEEVTRTVDEPRMKHILSMRAVEGHVQYLVVVRAWRLHYRPASHTHRVLGRAARPRGATVNNHWRVVPGRIYSIVWSGKGNPNVWGFLKLRDGRWCWQDWRTYVFGGGKHAPCE